MDARDLDAAYRLLFSGTWTHTSNGATPSSAFANTFFNFNTVYGASGDYTIGNYTSGLTTGISSGAFIGSTYIWVSDLFGLWRLELEKSVKKGRQDSMYRQTYDRSEDKKWYITYPGEWNQYDSRGKTKPGNFKTFKAIIEEFIEVKKVFDKISFFLENVLGIKGIDTQHSRSKEKFTVSFNGNLKDLTCYFLNIRYSREDKWGKNDPTKVQILHVLLSAGVGNNFSQPNFEKPLEEVGKNLKEVLEVLEILKDKPLDDFIKENLSWDDIKKKYSGKLTGTKYGL